LNFLYTDLNKNKKHNYPIPDWAINIIHEHKNHIDTLIKNYKPEPKY